MAKGGPRPGSGRPTKADEDKIVHVATKAIEEKYGSLEAGFQFLLGSGEPSLIRFAFEHATGKPREKVSIAHSIEGQRFKIGGQTIEF